MQWEDGNVKVSHPRQPWRGQADERTLVHCRLDELRGTHASYTNQTATYQAAYNRAKFSFDMEVAFEIVERCASEACLDLLADVVVDLGKEPIFIYPYLPFDDDDGLEPGLDLKGQPTNALPAAYARFLSGNLGGSVSASIFQSARVGRTKLTRWLRYLCQPSFEGEVDQKRPYIIVDDVISTGGTFATLRSYILSKGGTVAATTALAHKDGVHVKFAIADQTKRVLQSTYGPGLDAYWTGTFGHDPATLTDAEAQFLAVHQWKPGVEVLQQLRERVNQAAAKGD